MKTKLLSPALAIILLSGAALAGDAIVGFSHDNTADLSGYYLPPRDTKVGHFVLHNIALGSADDLKKWEAGKDRMSTWAPVMLSFTDLTSKMVQNEESGEMEHADIRVLPTAYRINGRTVAFIGANKQLGTVVFTGTLDVKRAAALNANIQSENPKQLPEDHIMKGDLTVGGTSFKNVSFSWFSGD
jgi:hypothetical protein